MGDNIKILFASMGFMAIGNATKLLKKPRARYFGEFGDISFFLRFLINFTYILTILAHKIQNKAYLSNGNAYEVLNDTHTTISELMDLQPQKHFDIKNSI